MRRLCRSFLDVNLPVRIKAVRHVDPYAAEFGKFGLPGEAEPGSVNDQPALPVNVEALVFHIPGASGVMLPFFRCDFFMVWKREGLNGNDVSSNADIFR